MNAEGARHDRRSVTADDPEMDSGDWSRTTRRWTVSR